MQRSTARQRYYIFASVMYIVLGMIIIARALIGHAPIIVVLGAVLVALGAIRLRDYRAWRARAG